MKSRPRWSAQIDPEILLIEAKRSAARPRVNATAYDLVLRSIPLMTRFERDSFRQAGEYLAQAIALEPDYAAAHAWYAYWHVFLVGQDWAVDPKETMRLGGEFAERAIVLDPFDARALTIAGHVRAFLHHSLHEAAASARARAGTQSEPRHGLGAVGDHLCLSGRRG